jgi:hypothetical protein
VLLELIILLDSSAGREQTSVQHLSEEHTTAKEVHHPLRQNPPVPGTKEPNRDTKQNWTTGKRRKGNYLKEKRVDDLAL